MRSASFANTASRSSGEGAKSIAPAGWLELCHALELHRSDTHP
jgi:hypothetical protein